MSDYEMRSKAVPRATDGARLVTIIQTMAIRGSGVGEDMVRYVYQYWSLEGKFLAEYDPLISDEQAKKYKKNVESMDKDTTNLQKYKTASYFLNQ